MYTYFFESAVQETNPHFKQQNVDNINSVTHIVTDEPVFDIFFSLVWKRCP